MSPRTAGTVRSYVASVSTLGGVSRPQLLREAYMNNAPHWVIVALLGLPDTYFWTVDEVVSKLKDEGA